MILALAVLGLGFVFGIPGAYLLGKTVGAQEEKQRMRTARASHEGLRQAATSFNQHAAKPHRHLRSVE